VATGVVVRFDSRRGYGFLAPDDGGEDVFVHQNNINMEGFRHLQVGERVSYELEVGEKGMKAVSVTLLEPRAPRAPRSQDGEGEGEGEQRPRSGRNGHGRSRRDSDSSERPQERWSDDDDAAAALDKLRRKQERLISLLVEKGLLTPGEIDGLETQAAAENLSQA
jgi:cold shock CspA family protein